MHNPLFTALRDLLISDRSVRRFDHSRPIPATTLKALVELTRYTASGRNLQPLRYRIISTPDECDAIFPALAWAGYYTDWAGPAPDQRPTAYLVQCLDTRLTADPMCDDGLQLQAVTLGAAALGIGACIIKSFNRKTICEALRLPDHMQPRYVLALGYRAEKVKIVDLPADGNYKYYRDDSDTQCVPKRPLDEIIIE